MIRIGILGGTFNPVHNGHLLMAEGAREQLKLDKILWIPAHLPPHKKVEGDTSPEERVKMVELAIEGRPYFQLSRVEVDRPPPSYTIDTVRKLQSEAEPGVEWYLFIGSDTARELPAWRGIAELKKRVRFAAIPRPGRPPAADALPYGTRELPVKTMDVSSSQVRQRLRAGQPVEGLVPAPVLRYIEERGLYR